MGLLKLVVITSLLMMLGKSSQAQLGTSFIFNSFNLQQITNLTYQGDAHIPQECKFLRLTKTNGSGVPGDWSSGRVVYSNPVLLSDSSTGKEADFDTTIKFTISPSKYNSADGIAFFIAPVGTTIPAGAGISTAGGNLAIYGPKGANPPLFAVEFDTYKNDWDPNQRHIGINLYSRISYNTTEFDSATGEEVTARITYVAKTSTVTVAASTCRQRATLSYGVKLSKILPQKVQIGLASSTGWPSDFIGVHDIHHWSFTSNLNAKAITTPDPYMLPLVSE